MPLRTLNLQSRQKILQTQLVAPAILQVSRDKQASQRHRNQAQHNSRKQRFNHGSISLTLSQILATNG